LYPDTPEQFIDQYVIQSNLVSHVPHPGLDEVTAYCLPSTYYLIPTTYDLLPTTYYLLYTTYYLVYILCARMASS
jgi:hypothetical protein